MRNHSAKEENILPPLERSKVDFQEKSTSRTVSGSTHKFKILETAVWANTAKGMINKDEISELDIRLNTQLKQDNSNSTEYLITLRRAYDDMVKNTERRRKETKRFREEIDAIKRQIELYNREQEAGQREVETLQKNFQTMKTKQETSAMAGKTLQHIFARMKKDEITNQIKINYLERRAKELEAAMSEFQHKKYQLNEFEALSSIAAREVKGSYIECSQKRKKDMDQYESLMKKKKQSDLKEEERRKITDQIQAIAASDLNDANLLKWKKLLMVQLVLKKILKSKINSIEAQYGDVKNAFHTIKINTTIDDPKNLTAGYFKFEDEYLTLLNNVKGLQERQKELQAEKQKFQKELERLNNQYNGINDVAGKQNEPQVMSLFKSTKETSERSFQIRLIEEKIYAWILQNQWKLEQAKQRTSLGKRRFFEDRSKQQLVKYMNDFCTSLIEFAEEMEKVTESEPDAMFDDLKTLQVIANKTPSDYEEEYGDVDECYKTVKKAARF